MERKAAYTQEDVARISGHSKETIGRAITQKYGRSVKKAKPLPRLIAHLGSRGKYIILHDDLEDWIRQLPIAGDYRGWQ